MTGGFAWDERDSNDASWYPQGVATGEVAGRDAVLVSWYSKDGLGIRVSLAPLGEEVVRYEHLRLVQAAPRWLDRKAAPRKVRGHAGGIAWVGHHLYVADTVRGMRVFDLDRITEVGGPGATWRWAVPQVGLWRLRLIPALLDLGPRFSFLSWSAASNAFFSGEYRKGVPGARIVSWPLPAGSGTRMVSDRAWVSERTNLQAVLEADGTILLASSAAYKPGKLSLHALGCEETRAWVVGPEDLASLGDDEVVSLTEHIHAGDRETCGRVVFSTRVAGLGQRER